MSVDKKTTKTLAAGFIALTLVGWISSTVQFAFAKETKEGLTQWLKTKSNVAEGFYQAIETESGERCLSEGGLTFTWEKGGQHVTLSLEHHILSYAMGKTPFENSQIFNGCTVQVAVSELPAGLSTLQSRICGSNVEITKHVLLKRINGFQLQNYRKQKDGSWDKWIDCTYKPRESQ